MMATKQNILPERAQDFNRISPFYHDLLSKRPTLANHPIAMQAFDTLMSLMYDANLHYLSGKTKPSTYQYTVLVAIRSTSNELDKHDGFSSLLANLNKAIAAIVDEKLLATLEAFRQKGKKRSLFQAVKDEPPRPCPHVIKSESITSDLAPTSS